MGFAEEVSERIIVARSHVALGPLLAPPKGDEQFAKQVLVESDQWLGPQKDGAIGLPCRMKIKQVLGGTREGIRNRRRMRTQPRQ